MNAIFSRIFEREETLVIGLKSEGKLGLLTFFSGIINPFFHWLQNMESLKDCENIIISGSVIRGANIFKIPGGISRRLELREEGSFIRSSRMLLLEGQVNLNFGAERSVFVEGMQEEIFKLECEDVKKLFKALAIS